MANDVEFLEADREHMARTFRRVLDVLEHTIKNPFLADMHKDVTAGLIDNIRGLLDASDEAAVKRKGSQSQTQQ